ncbi:peptidase S28 [Pterulicium gracile]|uniref:Peptidase S28 n=1 Tax=Pterulicium gracile TaxID=1884261 RepID=A0A5C3QUY5_9AGAR|nr:peptidase S28 [Pterula gracilis]
MKASVPKVSADNLQPSNLRQQIPPYDTVYYFNQLIDHNQPSLGTFRQRYWHTWEFYRPGGPIILNTPGEVNAAGYEGYLTNRTVNGLIAQQEGAAVVVLEHRFYGYSNPYPDLSSNSFRVHTIDQAIHDFVYFAENVVLPMPGGDAVTPATNPWILTGGSYPGALAGWTMLRKPGVFFAGYSSSGVVHAIENYWRYFSPILTHMPSACAADVQAAITLIDKTLLSKNNTAIANLKDSFGLGELAHSGDFAGALRNNLWDWQRLQPSSGSNTQFSEFCDSVRWGAVPNAPADGVRALAAWAAYFKDVYLLNLCGGIDAESCLGTYDPTQPYWTDTSTDNAWRSWFWIVCNELGFYQSAAPQNMATLVSRLLKPVYDERQCILMFPDAFKTPPKPRISSTNNRYQGWKIKVNRLFSTNGARDPWKDATLSAEGVKVQSTPSQPIILNNGFHCSDMQTVHGALDSSIAAVHRQALTSMHEWLSAYVPPEAAYRRQSAIAPPNSFGPGSDNPECDADMPPERVTKPINAWIKGF